uniref:Uncharacterized protein n=1 Tax=Arundo donax TaxID=35708 RepID=A0A0A9GXX4_ARUDO
MERLMEHRGPRSRGGSATMPPRTNAPSATLPPMRRSRGSEGRARKAAAVACISGAGG